jgi:molybdopterin-guanine dinucleotide biosynthesis protein A
MLRLLEQVSTDIHLSANNPRLYEHLGYPIVLDLFPGRGPLAGLHAGLRAARYDLLALVACDMPHASAQLFRYMRRIADDYDVVVPVREAFGRPGKTRAPALTHCGPLYEPLHAIYHRRCLPVIEETLMAGEGKITRVYPRVRVREVTEEELESVPGIDSLTFENVNTPEDMERLEAGDE